ncbi:MAG: NAD-dependent epimerase/dehydratase family protein [Chloroflexota bacterium]|nr:NAD-dependent epimerase/dehydratase family protein [Chloroflexota bacterium]MDE2910696.1 NAD-dependent epimerase/dehydratase family protein [Chloroflexota bacterium]
MKALVTGATGFVGSHLTRMFIERGGRARVLYRSEKKLPILGGLDVEAIAGDLDDVSLLEAACADCDVVFHVAAKADYWKDDDRDALWRVNVDGTRNLLTAAKSAGVRRFIFTSSASTIGIRPGDEPADESDAFNLAPDRFWYAWTKLKAEEVVAEFVADGMDIVTLNPTVIIGPGDLNAISGSFILETARWQWLAPMSSGGLAVIDARDVARAHLNAVERGRSGERYILNTVNLTYRQWFRMIARACGVRAPAFSMPNGLLEPTARVIELFRALGIQTPMDANQTRLGGAHVYFDGGKARRELFAPRIDIETSLRDAFDWYEQNGYIKRAWLSRLIGSI